MAQRAGTAAMAGSKQNIAEEQLQPGGATCSLDGRSWKASRTAAPASAASRRGSPRLGEEEEPGAALASSGTSLAEAAMAGEFERQEEDGEEQGGGSEDASRRTWPGGGAVRNWRFGDG